MDSAASRLPKPIEHDPDGAPPQIAIRPGMFGGPHGADEEVHHLGDANVVAYRAGPLGALE